ncbi:hypothetical protein [Shimia sp. R9_3]|uniref:hypothetical protein n=1 Tax=Shimia sp. R9_3 TaxID=2821113 RepID=UPI001ADA23CB|nr:hypothetical protein [Shimia sp. R9_3]MBO9402861.1 hypothetical protein [Shimia sp. R9_3]
MLIAQKLCEKNSFSFEATFRNQFLLTQNRTLDVPEWTEKSLNGWHLKHCQDLPVAKVVSATGLPIGFILGVAVDSDGHCVDGTQTLPCEETSVNFWDVVERYVIGLAGRYVAIFLTNDAQRVYTDPVADYAVVYDPDARIVASSLCLCLDREIHPNPIFPWQEITGRRKQYSLGHTRDFGVKRLLGNHYLGLRDFRPKRFWPRHDTDLETRPEDQVNEVVASINERLSQNLRALLRNHKCILPLSGGRDSRCLLGAGIEDVQSAEFAFTWRFHKQSGQDANIAQKICERLSIRHQLYSFQKTTFKHRQRYFLSNGYATFGPEVKTLAVHEQLPKGFVVLRGNIMGILRATNWARQREGSLNLEHAVKRLRIYGPDETQRDFQLWFIAFLEWYETLPAQGKNKVHDLAWLDITLPHSQGARWHGFPNQFYMNPFADRRLLSLSMQLPLKLRRNDKAYAALLDLTVPSLNDIPYV